MRASVVSALSLLLSGCAAMTSSGTEEALLFTPTGASSENARTELKPYNDLPLSIRFTCPDKIATLMTSYVVPLPPVLPMGFVNEHVSYLRVQMPEGADKAMAQARLVTPQGTALHLSDARRVGRTVDNDGRLEMTYALNKDCEAFDKGMLEVGGFSYKNKDYPPSAAHLRFASRIKASVAWWPPALFNGGRPVSGKIDAASAAQ